MCTYSGMLFTHRIVEILPSVTIWLNYEDMVLSAVGQTEKEVWWDW